MESLARLRIGVGFDVHRLVEGRICVLGGVLLPSPVGPDAHSDGDVLLHALIDALLGGSGQDDIGARFPNSDERYRGASSVTLLHQVWHPLVHAGWQILNLDCSVVCEAPKIGPVRESIKSSLARMLGIEPTRVGLKATTAERLGALGAGEGIAAQVGVLLLAPK